MKKQFEEFKEYIKGKQVAVVGIGVSNTPLIRMLISLGADVTACDKRDEIGEIKKELEELGVKLILGNEYLEGIYKSDVVFRTPSLLPNNKYLVKAKEKGINVTSEMAEFIKYCPCRIFGITGSDGKTTTTTLVGEMLRMQGYRVFVGGNIGTPLFAELENINENDMVVVELSSFQLMDIENSPEISVITNLSPNHLDYHKDMQEYIEAKKNIFQHQAKGNVLVINKDNEVTRQMENEAIGEARFFSIKDKNAYSYLDGDLLISNGEKICRTNEVIIPGMHNIENLLTAFTAVSGYVSPSIMRQVATTFKGVEHRIEFVREINGIRFYNGSIASSPTRTLADIKSFDRKVILIAGGYDKNIPFDELAEEGIDRIKLLVLMGNTKQKIKKAFEKVIAEKSKKLPMIEADSLEDAVFKAYENAAPGDVITLSPACASFDMYKNFEARGKAFKDFVNNI